MKNAEVVERLLEIADLLDVLGEKFKPEAYRRAARSIESLAEGVEEVVARGALTEVPGVGEAIDAKIQELLRTGALPYLDQLRREVPPGLRELMRLPGLGPKTVRRFWTEFGIEGPAELGDAIAAGKLAGARGFGEKKIAQVRAALEAAATTPAAGRLPIEDAYPLAAAIVSALKAGAPVHDVAVAGSFRRGRESVGDLDILATSDQAEKVFDLFSALPQVRRVLLRGPTKETAVLDQGLQVDLRVVEPEAFGAALQYFTGSKDHNVRLRSLARDRGLKLNEYGAFRGEQRIGGRTEEELYALLDLPWIAPELREDRGEIDLAKAGRLPKLIESDDLLGDLHVHLPPPGGLPQLEALLAAAKDRSLAYVGVVVAQAIGKGEVRLAPAPLLERLASGASREVRLFAVAEVDGPSLPPELASVAVDYLVARPSGSASRAAKGPAPPCLVVAHLPGPEGREAQASLDLARSVGAAVEVGPGEGRADSTLARVARESGLLLSVPTGLTEPLESPTRAVAVGFARRAGAEPKDVRNARRPAELLTAKRGPSRR